jgi:hypothetical protein
MSEHTLPNGAPCAFCGSDNMRGFNAEVAIHSERRVDEIPYKPLVWVFPNLLICSDCGCAAFYVPRDGQRNLFCSDAVLAISV